MHSALIKSLCEASILKYGEFVLRSGEVSDYYCDIKEALGYPKILELMVRELLKKVPKNATCIAGSGYGGISLATLVAFKKKLPLVLVRDTIKKHGTRKIIDGYVPTRKDTVLIIDDVYTTGSSIKDTKEKLLHTKAKFSKPLVVLNRSKKTVVDSVLSKEDLVYSGTHIK